jgi:uncharacterized membrane protein
MTKEQFLFQLEQQLLDLPQEERAAAMEYYRDYFDDAGAENEAEVIRELGSPTELAAVIREGLASEPEPDKSALPDVGDQPSSFSQASKSHMDSKSKWILIILVAVFTSPIWIGLIGTVFGLLVAAVAAFLGLVVALAALVLAGIVGGVVVVGAGIYRFFSAGFVTAVMTCGVGMLLIAAGLLSLLILTGIFGKGLPWLISRISKLFCNVRKRGKRVMVNE